MRQCSKLIVAPHPDDETLGCWSVLPGSLVLCTWDRKKNEGRAKEIERASEFIGFDLWLIRPDPIEVCNWFNDWYEVRQSSKIPTPIKIFAPDPFHETHPLHRALGQFVWWFCFSHSLRFVSYSTCMNSPYVLDLPNGEPEKKREALDACYRSQKSLWEGDHRCFLFEGLSEWILPAGD